MLDIKKALVEELHTPARRNFLRRKVSMRGLDDTWQADLVEIIPYARENKGYRYLLTVIDTFSKFAWAIPVSRKTGLNVASAFKTILSEGRVPKNLHVDQGTEFYKTHCQNLFKKYKINLYSTYSFLKASICERFNRTLKMNMWKQFSLRGRHMWIDILPQLILKYNDSKHRTINMKPIDVNAENSVKLMKLYKRQTLLNVKHPKFNIGDKVHISKYKHIFDKGYTPNWTTEVFTIEKVMSTAPYTYKLKDYQGESVVGGFYEEELLKANHPDHYLVEKVIKKRGDRIYVKWLGFDNSHNSWIFNDEVKSE